MHPSPGDSEDYEGLGTRRLTGATLDKAPHAGMTFQRIYEHHFEQVARWVQALGVANGDRDDVVHEVFLVVHRRLADFDGENVKGWLYQIARRKVRDYRQLSWVKHVLGGSSPVTEDTLKTLRVPLDALETTEKARLLTSLLSTLNPDQSAAFVLFEIEGTSGEEIARLQGVALNTVWARIHKARCKLRKELARLETQAARPSARV